MNKQTFLPLILLVSAVSLPVYGVGKEKKPSQSSRETKKPSVTIPFSEFHNSTQAELQERIAANAVKQPVPAPEDTTVVSSEEQKESKKITPQQTYGLWDRIWKKSDRVEQALQMLITLAEGSDKQTQTRHEVEWAINAINEKTSEEIKQNKKNDIFDILSIQKAIASNKPHIEQLQELVKLSKQKKLDLPNTELQTAYATLKAHNTLLMLYSKMVCNACNEAMHNEKEVRRTIYAYKPNAGISRDDLSDDEYDSAYEDLFTKIVGS